MQYDRYACSVLSDAAKSRYNKGVKGRNETTKKKKKKFVSHFYHTETKYVKKQETIQGKK